MRFEQIDAKAKLEELLRSNPELIPLHQVLDNEFDLILSLVDTRKSKGLTQKEVAKKMGVTEKVVSKIEKIENNTPLEVLLKYTNAIGVKLTIEPMETK